MRRALASSMVLVLMVFVCGCVADPVYVEEDFGQSVTQMLNGQIADPKTASNPDLQPSDLLDGAVGRNSVESYRRLSELENIRKPGSFEID